MDAALPPRVLVDLWGGSPADFLSALVAADAVHRGGSTPYLLCPYLPAARQDRGAPLTAPGRDPRTRVITVAYVALIRPDLMPLVVAGSDASDAVWCNVHALKANDLAFDHSAILHAALAHVRGRIQASAVAASLVPSAFTTPERRHVHAVLTGEPQDPGNFRRKFESLLATDVVEQAPGKRITASKPALVYRFVGVARVHKSE